jgi:uncharacterized repeat protein (TIGR02543 family)
MRRIPLKALVYAVLCAMGVVCLSGCVQPVDLVAFAQGAGAWRDENNSLHIIPGGDTTIKEGFNTITKLDPGKYYMVEEWKDNFDPTDFQFVSSSGVRSSIAGVGKVSGATITGLNNRYHYRVRAATPLDVVVNYTEYPTASTGSETPEGGVIDLTRPTDYTYSHTYYLTPDLPPPLSSYSVAEISADGSSRLADKDINGNITTKIYKDTVVDYVFFRDDGSALDTTTPATYEFYFLRIGTPIPTDKVFVRFYINDGTIGIHDTRYVTSGSSISLDGLTMPDDPERTDFVFDGWWTGDGLGDLWLTAFTGTTVVSGAANTIMPVYARWVGGAEVTVTFDYNGEGTPSETQTTNTSGKLTGPLPTAPARTGYTFDGWYRITGTTPPATGSAAGWGTKVTVGSSGTTFAINTTVYARWMKDVTVTFDYNDGTTPSPSVTRTGVEGSTIGTTNWPTNPDRTGYTFVGWYTASGSGGTAFTTTTPVTDDMTVYARWQADSTDYTVTFRSWNYTTSTNVTVATATVTPTTAIDVANVPGTQTQTGYTFLGWYTLDGHALGGTNVANWGTQVTGATVPTGDMNAYARWLQDGELDGVTSITLTPIGGTAIVLYNSTGTATVAEGQSITVATGGTLVLIVQNAVADFTGGTIAWIRNGTNVATGASLNFGTAGTAHINTATAGTYVIVVRAVTAGGEYQSSYFTVVVGP